MSRYSAIRNQTSKRDEVINDHIKISRKEFYGFALAVLLVPTVCLITGFELGKNNYNLSSQRYSAESIAMLESHQSVAQHQSSQQLSTLSNVQSAIPATIELAVTETTEQFSDVQQSNPQSMAQPIQLTQLQPTINARQSGSITLVSSTNHSELDNLFEQLNQTRFIVQVALFKDRTRANNWIRARDDGFTYAIVPRVDSQERSLYAVIIGQFADHASAKETAAHFKMLTQQDAYVASVTTAYHSSSVASL